MTRRLTTLLLAAAVLLAAPTAAQTPAALADSARLAVEAAAERGDLAGLDAALAFVERALALHPADPLLRHYHGYALYRAGTAAMGVRGAGGARPYFERAAAVLEPLAAGPTIPETHALLASVYGMQIAASRAPALAGMRLGPKSNEWMGRAVEAGPRNPRVWTLRGIGALNTPKAFGGGAERAEEYLKTALALFAADSARPPLPAWGRADAHAWLGQVYAKQGKRDAARAEYRAALTHWPRNPWITNTLLARLDRPR